MDNSHKNVKATIYLKGCYNDEEIQKKCRLKTNEIGVIFGVYASGKFFCEPLSEHTGDSFTSTSWNLLYIDSTDDNVINY